jgi:alanyl-tRNA synthetase
MTDQLYLKDTYLFESDAKIIEYKKDNRDVPYVLLDQTIFYPQGGGQPCDHGKIVGDDFEYAVCDVRQIEEEIRHYIEPSQSLSQNPPENSVVKCTLDKDRRLLNIRYHTRRTFAWKCCGRAVSKSESAKMSRISRRSLYRIHWK